MVAEEATRLERRRLEKFHQRCKERCNSPKTFSNSFEIDSRHIAEGTLKNPRRFGLTNEHLAAVIRDGFLLVGKSNAFSSAFSAIEIAVTALFRQFKWTDYGNGSVREVTEAIVKVRVLTRERPKKKKDLIATAYVEDVLENDKDLPEVSHEIW